MRIEKYNAEALKEFLASEEYANMPFVPVSMHRAESWLKNPRLKPDDTLMYLGYDDEGMIAYRCMLPDHHGSVRFGWLSGVWVRPDQRRRGLAGKLLEEAYRDWGHQLMVTNYAPGAKSVFEKTRLFSLYKSRPGIRYYQRSSAAKLLGDRRTVYRRSRPLLQLADGMLNLVQDIRIQAAGRPGINLEVRESPALSLEVLDLLEKSQATGFCMRNREDFEWITSHPWIRQTREEDTRYYFSSVSKRFRNICIEIRNTDSQVVGFLWLVLNGDKMTIPYEVLTAGAEPYVSAILNKYMQTNRVAYLTCYQSRLNKLFIPGPLLGTRPMTQNYYATHDLIRQLPDPEGIQFQDGDGDVVFV